MIETLRDPTPVMHGYTTINPRVLVKEVLRMLIINKHLRDSFMALEFGVGSCVPPARVVPKHQQLLLREVLSKR